MAGLNEIRAALAQTIKENVSVPLFAYDTVEDINNTPCVMIEPAAADFEGAFQRGMHTWEFNLFVLCSKSASSPNGQRLLDKLVGGTGPDSIVRILEQNPTLGLPDTDAQCYMLKGYGGSFDWARVQHVGAVLKVRVITDPR